MSSPLSPGERGVIRARKLPSGKYQADCLYVDMSGKQVRVRRTRDTTNATRAKYQREIEYVIPYVGGLRIDHVDAASLQAGIDKVQLNISRDAARHAKGRMGQACRWAARMRILDTNPMPSVELSGRPARRRAIAPSEAQIQTLRSVLTRYIEAPRSGPKSKMPLLAFEILAGTGARIAEACALHWPDVDLEAGTITFRDTVVDDDGPRVLRGHLKNGDPFRISHIPSRLITVLKEARSAAGDLEGPVVASQTGTMMQPENIRRAWRSAYTYAKVPAEERLTPHSLRRAVATKLKQELGTQGAADQLGDTIMVAEKHYVAPTYAGPKEAARILNTL